MADETQKQVEGGAAVEEPKRTHWIFVNRQVYPVHLPDPFDPGSSVRFPPVPDKKTTLLSGMYQVHPFFDHFTRIKRSIVKEPAPDYLDANFANVPTGPTIHDMLNMHPDAIKGFLEMLKERDPEMAAEIAASFHGKPGTPARPNVPNPLQPSKGPITQAPPGA